MNQLCVAHYRLSILAIKLFILISASLLILVSKSAATDPKCQVGNSDKLSCISESSQYQVMGSLKPFLKPDQPRYFDPFSSKRRTSTPYESGKAANVSVATLSKNARVVSRSFQRINRDTGEWSGIVQGIGTIELYLKILLRSRGSDSDSSPPKESIRKLGEVSLNGQPSTFRARAPIPLSDNWNWDIEVRHPRHN